MRRCHVWLALGGLVALAGPPVVLHAQGFSVNEHGTCAMGRAGTGVADPCKDGSAMFYNPAGVASAEKGRWTISLGGTGIAPSGGFTDDVTGLESKLNNNVYPVPSAYLTWGISDKVAVGIGAFAPYGLTTDWPTFSQGRYLGYKSVIRAIYVQPTLAAKLNKYVKLGAGFDLDFAKLQLRQRVDLAEVPPFPNLGIPTGTDFADIDLHGTSTGVGYHAGVIIQPSPRFSLGARYLSRQKVTFDNGTAEVAQAPSGIILAAGNPFGVPAGTPLDSVIKPLLFDNPASPFHTQGAKTVLRLPEQWTFGVAGTPVDKLKLLFDVMLTHWEVFDTLPVDFTGTVPLPSVRLAENFQNVTAWRWGAEYAASATTAIRAGYILHDAAEPAGSVTPNLPEGNRSEFTFGLGIGLSKSLNLDLAYQYIDQQDRRGRTVEYGQPDNGLFAFKAHLFGAHVTYTF